MNRYRLARRGQPTLTTMLWTVLPLLNTFITYVIDLVTVALVDCAHGYWVMWWMDVTRWREEGGGERQKCYGRTWGKKETNSLGSWRKKKGQRCVKNDHTPHRAAHTHTPTHTHTNVSQSGLKEPMNINADICPCNQSNCGEAALARSFVAATYRPHSSCCRIQCRGRWGWTGGWWCTEGLAIRGAKYVSGGKKKPTP